jgi:hypothetical protein
MRLVHERNMRPHGEAADALRTRKGVSSLFAAPFKVTRQSRKTRQRPGSASAPICAPWLSVALAHARCVDRPLSGPSWRDCLGHLGKLGSNVNQLAHRFNRDGRFPGLAELTAIRQDIASMREALMKALGRGD